MEAQQRELARKERKQEQAELLAERRANNRQIDRRQSLLAAATSLGNGASVEQVLERADQLLTWLQRES